MKDRILSQALDQARVLPLLQPASFRLPIPLGYPKIHCWEPAAGVALLLSVEVVGPPLSLDPLAKAAAGYLVALLDAVVERHPRIASEDSAFRVYYWPG